MGKKEYGIKINSVDDATFILNVVKSHNEHNEHNDLNYKSGEFLYIIGYLNFNDDCWMILMNHGGGCYTYEWFRHFIPSHIEWYDGEANLPDGWFDCNDFIWNSKDNDQDNTYTYLLPQMVVDYLLIKDFKKLNILYFDIK